MKKKILFDVTLNSDWIGGVYYMRNIVYQICCNPDVVSEYTPVVLCPNTYKELFGEFQGVIELYTVNPEDRIHRFLRLMYVLKDVDYIYYYHQYKFDPLNLLEEKAIYWIPDFQECYYPEFFTNEQLSFRKQRGEHIAKSYCPLVLSSLSCASDFNQYFPTKKGKTVVIPFVSAIENELEALTKNYCDDVLSKYHLDNKRYVVVSNQFWQHKNHIIVFQAICRLKAQKKLQDVYFVFTGELKDYRNADYYNSLTTIINENDIEDKYTILGFIDRKEQLAIMAKATLVLQPSLFEGWGTVVEDAKVLDKTIVLSDIPVHREQMNEKCYLFDPSSSERLIDALETALVNNVESNIERGIENMKKSALKYSEKFKEILLENER